MRYQIPQEFKRFKKIYYLTERLIDIIAFTFIFSTLSMLVLSGSPYAGTIIVIWLFIFIIDMFLFLIALLSIFYYSYISSINKILSSELRFVIDFIHRHKKLSETISLDDYKKIWWIFVLIRRNIIKIENRERKFLDLRSMNCLKNLVKKLEHIRKILQVLKISEMKDFSKILEKYAKIFENNTYGNLYEVDEEFKKYIENNTDYKKFLEYENEMKFKSRLYRFFKKFNLLGTINRIIQNKDRIKDLIKILVEILLGILSITVIIYWIYNYQTIANLPEVIMEIIKTFL